MMCPWNPVAVIVTLGMILCCGQSSARTWADSTGKHRIEGDFVKLADGKVDIRCDDGKLVRIPLDKLCEDDQTFVRKTTKPAAKETPASVPDALRRTDHGNPPDGAGAAVSDGRDLPEPGAAGGPRGA